MSQAKFFDEDVVPQLKDAGVSEVLIVGNDFYEGKGREKLSKGVWTCYIRGEANCPLTDIIKRVEFVSPVKSLSFRDQPYEISGFGCQFAEIIINVHFNPSCNKGPIQFKHQLVFENGGNSQKHKITFEKIRYGYAERKHESKDEVESKNKIDSESKLASNNLTEKRVVAKSLKPKESLTSSGPKPLFRRSADEKLNAAFLIVIARVGLGLQFLQNSVNPSFDPLPFVIAYLDFEESVNLIIKDVMSKDRDWSILKDYAHFDHVWTIVRLHLARFNQTDWNGRGGLLLSLNGHLREWIWQHRQKKNLFFHLGLGKGAGGGTSQTWKLEDLENHLSQRNTKNSQVKRQKYLGRKHNYRRA